MSPPLQALLRYAFAEDLAGIRAVLDHVHQVARLSRAPDAEDAAQELVTRLFATPAKARNHFDTLARHNSGLAVALLELRAGAVPALGPDLFEQVSRQVGAYIARALRNAATDAHRRQRAEPLPDDDDFAGSTETGTASELQEVVTRVLGAIKLDPDRPAWLDGAIEAVLALAMADQTMEALTRACIASDPSLSQLAPDRARTRARNRLQQQHKRAREHLAATAQRLRRTGDIDDEQTHIVELWLGRLIRRQNQPARPSRRSEP